MSANAPLRAARATLSDRTVVLDAPAPGVYRELVGRILRSPTFSRSARLSTLLEYVCDMSLEGRDTELNEQVIGQAVFGRPRDYDSSIDGIVRTQASRLRQRLEMYFDQEGSEEPIKLVIPKGGYVPVFQPRLSRPDVPTGNETDASVLTPLRIEPGVAAFAHAASESDVTALRSFLRGRALPWMLTLLLCLTIAGVALWRELNSPARAVARHPLWGQLFTSGSSTLGVPADSGLVLSHAFDLRPVPLSDYLAGDYRNPNADASTPTVSPEFRSLRSEFGGRRYTSIVDLEAAVRLAEMAQAAHSSLQMRYARDVRPNDLKEGNVILIGAAEANPWVELFERNMNFVLRNDYHAHIFSVINQSPQPGESARYDSALEDPQHRVYGVVAFVPSLTGKGNVLIIEGTSMAGTEAAWDFVSDDAELLPLLKRIQTADGHVPHFELLLGTQNVGASAAHSSVLAYRVMR